MAGVCVLFEVVWLECVKLPLIWYEIDALNKT